MREIKFRGLVESQNSGMNNTPTNIWVYGSLIVEPTRCFIQWVDTHNIVRSEIVVTESVGQLIGLKDKHGTPIFEGDIVTPNGQEIGIVKWWEGTFSVDYSQSPAVGKTYYGISAYKYLEVIGNIYENPELLTTNTPEGKEQPK